jgi:hypothetical protein
MSNMPYIVNFAFHDWHLVLDCFFLEAGDEVFLEEVAFGSGLGVYY